MGVVENKIKSQNTSLSLKLIVVVSIVATLGSLYFSEIQLFIPCEMCWYQRILMYPIVLISLTGHVIKDKNVGYYTLILSSLGICISGYHYLLQKVSVLGDKTSCSGDVPCTLEYINYLGFITIPFLSFTAFVIIMVLSILYIKGGRK